jgi:peptide/nickel transport system permease protein
MCFSPAFSVSSSNEGTPQSQGRNYLRLAWWISAFPGLVIMITVLAVNLVGDGLRDALDPRMHV